MGWRSRHEIGEKSLDAALVISFCWMGFKFTFLASFISFFLAWYYSRFGDSNTFLTFTILNLLQADDTTVIHTNLFVETPARWPVVACAYVLVLALCLLSIEEWRKFQSLKRAHFLRLWRGELGVERAQAARSLMVENIPKEQFNVQGIQEFFELLFGKDCIHSVLLQDKDSSHFAVVTSDKTFRLLEDSEHDSISEDEHQGIYPLNSAIQVSQSEPLLDAPLEDLFCGLGIRKTMKRSLLKVAKVAIGSGDNDTAFVTFKSVQHALIGSLSKLSPPRSQFDKRSWMARPAPEARDIIWANAWKSRSQIQLRKYISRSLSVFALILWSVPVFALQTPVLLPWLSSRVKWIRKFEEDNPQLAQTFWTSYFPVWGMMLLMSSLPKIFLCIARYYEGMKLKSGVAKSALGRACIFQLATVLLSVISGSLYMMMFWIVGLNGSMCIWKILGSEIPRRGVYFATFIIARVGFSLPLLLLNSFPFNSPCMAGKEKQIKAYCNFAAQVADISLIFTLALMFVVIAPIITWAACAYFFLATFVYMWLFAYAYTEEYDSQGKFFVQLWTGVMIGLLLGTACLASLFSSGEAAEDHTGVDFSPLAAAMWLLLVLEGLYIYYMVEMYARDALGNGWQFLSDAAWVDLKEQSEQRVLPEMREDYYQEDAEEEEEKEEQEAEEDNEVDEGDEDESEEDQEDMETSSLARCIRLLPRPSRQAAM